METVKRDPMSEQRLGELRKWRDKIREEQSLSEWPKMEALADAVDEIDRLLALVAPITHAAPIKWMGDAIGWQGYRVWRRDQVVPGRFKAFCGASITDAVATGKPTCKTCIKRLAGKTDRDRSIYVPEAKGFAFQRHIDIANGEPCGEPRCKPEPCAHCVPISEPVRNMHRFVPKL